MGGLRTGILGGTFDPPHLGHLVLAAAARRTLALDHVLWIPAGEPWRKANEHAVSAVEARVRMSEAAVKPFPWMSVSTVEAKRPGPSYSSETVEQLVLAGGDWWFIIGDDALADMPHWHEPSRLLAAARLAVASRDSRGTSVPDALRDIAPDIEDRVDFVAMPRLGVSATDLRERVRRGQRTDVLLPEGVRAVVDELGLYRGRDEA